MSTAVKFDTQAIADEFTNVLRKWLTADELEEIDELNANEDDESICHSHDFCDANMAMLEAFRKLYPDVDVDNIIHDEKIMAVWNEAWGIAKDDGFVDEVATDETRAYGPHGAPEAHKGEYR